MGIWTRMYHNHVQKWPPRGIWHACGSLPSGCVFSLSFFLFLFFCNNFSKLQSTQHTLNPQNFQARKLLTCNSKNMLTLQTTNVFFCCWSFEGFCFRWICEWRWRWAVHVRQVAGVVKTHLQLLPKYHVPYVYIYISFFLSVALFRFLWKRVRWVTSLTCIWGMH